MSASFSLGLSRGIPRRQDVKKPGCREQPRLGAALLGKIAEPSRRPARRRTQRDDAYPGERDMKRLVALSLMIVFLATGLTAVAQDKSAKIKEALGELNEFIGEWNGTAGPAAKPKEFWKE